MHEMSLISTLIEMIKQQANQTGFTKVKAVWLKTGKLAAVEPEALTFCFNALSQNNLLKGASLNLMEENGKAFCESCNQEFNISRYGEPCPHCKQYGLKITGGNNVFIDKIEVE